MQNDFSLLPVSPRNPYVASRYESWECAPGSAAGKGQIQCHMLRVTPAGQMLEVNQINTRGTELCAARGKKGCQGIFHKSTIHVTPNEHLNSNWTLLPAPVSDQRIRINLSNINKQTRCSSLLPGPAGNMLLSGYQAGASSAGTWPTRRARWREAKVDEYVSFSFIINKEERDFWCYWADDTHLYFWEIQHEFFFYWWKSVECGMRGFEWGANQKRKIQKPLMWL